jgi:hypothetical protein
MTCTDDWLINYEKMIQNLTTFLYLGPGVDWGQKASAAIVLKRPQRHCGKNEAIATISLKIFQNASHYWRSLQKISHHLKKPQFY